MAQQREEAWKKIHKAAMDNPIKDKVQGYDQVFRLTYNHVSIYNLQWWKSKYFSKRFKTSEKSYFNLTIFKLTFFVQIS